MLIPRTTFAFAVQAGMVRAGELLSPDDVKRIQVVARDATAFTNNFAERGREGTLNCGCPGSQAALPQSNSSETSPIWQFACGFDDYLIASKYGDDYAFGSGTIQVGA